MGNLPRSTAILMSLQGILSVAQRDGKREYSLTEFGDEIARYLEHRQRW